MKITSINSLIKYFTIPTFPFFKIKRIKTSSMNTQSSWRKSPLNWESSGNSKPTSFIDHSLAADKFS